MDDNTKIRLLEFDASESASTVPQTALASG